MEEYNGCLSTITDPILSFGNRLNCYASVMAGIAMVEIQCPHCDEDVEVGNVIFGLFDCPHCNNEFQWGEESDSISISFKPKKAATLLLACSLFFAIGAGVIYFEPEGYDGSSSTQCDDCTLEEQLIIDAGEGIGEGIEQMLAITCLVLFGAFLFVAAVTYFIQLMRAMNEANQNEAK
jgi:hypothetical protein